MRDTVIVFARAPVLGAVKRRLARDIGDRAALRAAEAFRGGGQFVKKPIRVMRAFGLINLLRFRFGLGPIHHIFQRISRHLNVDIAPLVPIIANAGGIVTTWTGGPPEEGGNCIAAATPELHAEVMRVIAAA